jgi:hypothetical protein
MNLTVHGADQGSTIRRSTLRVTTVIRWTKAVAAMRPSMVLRGRIAARRPPLERDILGDGQDTFGVIDAQPIKPKLQSGGRRRIVPSLQSDSLGNFAQCQCAQIDLVWVDGPEPIARFSSAAPRLGKYVRVDQIHQNTMLRSDPP